MADLPTIDLAGVTVSRFIVGGNPFSGGSHMSAALDREMRDYYTVERIKATFRDCEGEGINTFLGRGDNHIRRMLIEYWNEGGTIQWIAQTAPEMASVTDNIRQIAATGAKCCFTHGGMTDRMEADGTIADLRAALDLGRELGMAMGIAGHRPRTHLRARELELGAQFHCCCLYNLADRHEEYLPEDREAIMAVIRQLDVPVIAYKIMAAGRNDPEEAWAYAFSHLRPTDAVCVGVFTKHKPDEVHRCAELTRRHAAV
jgi:hypothetical protein